MDDFALLNFRMRHLRAPPNTLAPNNSLYFTHNISMLIMQAITFMFLGWYANVRIGWKNFKIPEVLQV